MKQLAGIKPIRTALCKTNGIEYSFYLALSSVFIAAGDDFVSSCSVSTAETVAQRLESKDYTGLQSSYTNDHWHEHYPLLYALEVMTHDSDYGLKVDLSELDKLSAQELAEIKAEAQNAWGAYWRSK